jgi:hypothetical protein
MQRNGKGNTEPVFVALNRGVSFAAKFRSAAGKTETPLDKAEAQNFRSTQGCGEDNTET